VGWNCLAMCRLAMWGSLMIFVVGSIAAQSNDEAEARGARKIRDFAIYQEDKFYCAFPSVVVRKNGEILCAFRRAPNRRLLWGAPRDSHTDPNSHLVLVRSMDGGKTWTKEPELIYAHPLGGSQDPCMVQLKDGSIVCTSYAWALLPPEGAERIKECFAYPPFAFLGGYIMRSDDGGKSWRGPFVPVSVPGNKSLDALGNPLPAYNRGAILQRKDGRLYWAVARHDRLKELRTSVHLLTSSDRGETWQYVCPIASDEEVSFNEASLIETKNGDLVAFMRTEGLGGKAAYARSTDGGRSFGRWQDGGFVGHPFQAVRLKDGRVFLVYGCRQAPFGIRAKLLNPECTDIVEALEIVIRDDGGNSDIGYPWAAVLPDGNVLVAYYFNVGDGPRFIAGSLLSVE